MMRTIPLAAVNQFVLDKHHLTDESTTDNLVQIVKDVGGLHATGPTGPYLVLFARTRHFTRERLDEELYGNRTLGKLRCMRKTVYVLLKELIPVAFAATRRMIEPTSAKYAKYLGITQQDYDEVSAKILVLLKGKGLPTRELKKALGTRLPLSPIVNLMCDTGLVIRGRPAGGWKSNLHTYHLFEEYFPDLDLQGVDEEVARRRLVERYLTSFGPATENDVAWWTGFPKGQIRHILKDCRDAVSSVAICEVPGNHPLLSRQRPKLASTKPLGKPVINVLPSLDPYLMGYKDRGRYLYQKHYPLIFDRSGNATSTILRDGRVVGIWDMDVTDDREPVVKTFLFEDNSEDVQKEIAGKARKVGQFIADQEVQIHVCDAMIPLTQRPAGAVMTPLKGG